MHVLILATLLVHIVKVNAGITCTRALFGTPHQQNCANALASLPRDEVIRYFVDQQLRLSPLMDWPTFADPRSNDKKQQIVQVPKWWSSGACNIALLSYVHENSAVPLSASQWSIIFAVGLQLIIACVKSNLQGGLATVNDHKGKPSLTLFIWEDGAHFENIMNGYMAFGDVSGIDPKLPLTLLRNVSSIGNLMNGTTVPLPGNSIV